MERSGFFTCRIVHEYDMIIQNEWGVDMKEIIHFYHTNDWHSHLETWPKFLRYYQTQSDKHRNEGEAHFLFDIGDAVDRQHPFTEASQGQNMVTLMNEMGVDVATIGNNEGIGSQHDILDNLYEHADFPVVLGNILDKKSGQPPKYTKEYTMIQTSKGTRFAVLGMTAPFEISYGIVGWEPIDPILSIARVLTEIKAKESFDGILLLSHLGLSTDREIAARFPEILAIFGAHTHHVLPEGEWVGHTLLTGGGKYGQFMGHLTLEINKGQEIDHLYTPSKMIPTHQADDLIDYPKYFKMDEELIASDRISNYAEDDDQVAAWLSEGENQLKQQIVGHLPVALTADENQYSPLQFYTLTTMKEASGADIAMVNSGLFLDTLPAGPVSKHDLHKALPHPIRLMMVECSLKEYVNEIYPQIEILRPDLQAMPIKGSGFRGKVFGQLMVLKDEQLDQIDQNQIIKIITIDHILYLPFFTELINKHHYLWDQPFIRELIADKIHQTSSQDSTECKEG